MGSYDNIPHDDHFMALVGFIANRFADGPFGTKHIYRALQGTDIPYAAHPRLCAVLQHMTAQGQLERISRSIWMVKPSPAPVPVEAPKPEPLVRDTFGAHTDRLLGRMRGRAVEMFDQFLQERQSTAMTWEAMRAEFIRILETTVR